MEKIASRCLLLSWLVLLAFYQPLSAEVLGPGWHRAEPGDITHKQAQLYYQQKQQELDQQAPQVSPLSTMSAASATTQSPRIIELARALKNDPKLIYDYVHNHIDFIPYFGSIKGAELALLDEAGNAFDQASLMVALLRASNITANYLYGTIKIPGPEMVSWLQLDTPLAVGRALSSGYIPIDSWYASGEATFEHVWVQATIAGTDYVFDPSFKQYTKVTGIDINQAMGYDYTALVNSAMTGSTLTTEYVQNINTQNLENTLTQYTNGLVNAIESTNASANQVYGGYEIDLSTLSALPTSLPFPNTVIATWAEIPAAYRHTFSINFHGILHTFNTDELAGQRLTLSFNNTRPELRLDGVLIGTGNTTITGQDYTGSFSIDHAFVSSTGDDTQADQTVNNNIQSGSTHAIFYSFFAGKSDKRTAQKSTRLAKYLSEGLPTGSEAVLGETLDAFGVSYAHQDILQVSQNANIAGVIHSEPHLIGFVGQRANDAGFYIDIPMSVSGAHTRSANEAGEDFHFTSKSFYGSALEHSILEQLGGPGTKAASTVKLLTLANDLGDKIYHLTRSNYPSINGQLINHTPQSLAIIQTYLDTGQDIGQSAFVPENGIISVNQWQGTGFLLKVPDAATGQSYIISGGYNGGFSGGSDPIDYGYFDFTLDAFQYNPGQIFSLNTPFSCDPVDMVTGDFFYDHTDLSLRGHSALTFSRHYNNRENFRDRSLGYGWTHNNDIYLTRTNNAMPRLGSALPVDAASSMVAATVTFDLMKNEDTLRSNVMASLVANWHQAQMLDNAVTIHIGNKSLQFIKRLDGSYSSPANTTATLVKNANNTFKFVERFGSQLNFNSNDKISTITDADSNTITFTYDTSQRVKTVSTNFSQNLTYTYNGTRLQSVADSAGRSVSFTYEADNDLDTYTDPEGKVWSYDYDADHRLTSIFEPVSSTIPIVTNIYDAMGQVKTQLMPLQSGGTAAHDFYFSGYRNEEEDSANHSIVYHADKKGRTHTVTDRRGYSSTTEYDGQNHVTKITDSRQQTTQFLYDGAHNLRFLINDLSQLTENVYDTLHRLTDIKAPLLNTTHFGYDSEHHLDLTRDGESNEFTATFYANGTKKTDRDGRNIVTGYTYDARGNLKTSRLAVTPSINYTYNTAGLLESLTDQADATTTFTYNNRDQVKEITDPLSKKTIFTYEDAGRLKTVTDRRQRQTIFDYTPSGKLETIDYAIDPTVSFTYNSTDIRDNLDAMADAIGTTNYGYDAANQLTSVQDPHGFNVGYRYDEVGNLDRITYPGNKTVTYTYDDLNRLKTVKIDWLAGTPTTSYFYDSAGRLDYIQNFNGSITDYTFDKANRLTNLVNKKSNNTIISSHLFTSLDGNGNRLQEVREEPITPNLSTARVTHSYNSQRNRLTSTTSASLTYDTEGQQQTKNGVTYIFDNAHRLKQIGADTKYFYDGNSNRLRVKRGTVINRYIYDNNNNLLAEANNGSWVQRYFIHGLGLLGMVEGNNLYTYHFDATGNTLAMTNASQNYVNRYAYSAYGKIAAQNETIPQPFKYVGQFGVQYEADHHLYYMRARYYDPDTGRFISEDPIGFGGGQTNLYAYVGGDPVNNIDPTGLILCPNCITAGIGAVIGGVSGGLTAYVQDADLGDIARSTAIGALAGAATGFTFGASATIAVGGAASGLGSISGQYITSGNIELDKVILSSIAGTTGGAFGVLSRSAGQSVFAQTLTSSLATAETQALFDLINGSQDRYGTGSCR